MNSMETELTSALDAAAETVRAQTLRPLMKPQARRARRVSPWLAPIAAASAVALIIGLAVTIAGHVHTPRVVPPAVVAATAPPRYYIDIAVNNNTSVRNQPPVVMVQSVATGAVIGRIASPAGTVPVDVAAASDDRTFYVAYQANDGIRIYSFSMTARGTLTPMTAIKGGFVDAPDNNAMLSPNIALSPDGADLALSVSSTTVHGEQQRGWNDVLVVISLRTGAHRVWQGGLYRPGEVLSIPSISWAGSGTLDFVSFWCTSGGDTLCTPASNTQVRTLSVATDGGSLAASTVLLSASARYPGIAAVAAGTSGRLYIMALSRADAKGDVAATVDQVSAATGAVQRVLYRRADFPVTMGSTVFGLRADPSGQYLLAVIYSLRWEEVSGSGAPHELPGTTSSDGIAWLGITQAVLRIRVLLWA